jgi:hypothetical protein
LLQGEEAGVLSITFNDVNAGRDVEDTVIEDTLARMRIGDYGTKERLGVTDRAVFGLLNWMKQVGDFIETLPKAAAVAEFKEREGVSDVRDLPADVRSFIRRKVGSPDFLMKGVYTPVTNEFLLFSNAIGQAIRADAEVARDPATRSEWWWKTVSFNIVPKLAIFGAILAASWDDDDEGAVDTVGNAYASISEYDRTNYHVVPVWKDAQGNTVYFRIPQDDAGRLIGGITQKLLNMFKGDHDVIEAARQVFDYSAGQFPSLMPGFKFLSDVRDFASGNNVYDSYRGRFLFTPDELKAKDSRSLTKFIGYEFQQMGGGVFWKFYPGEQRPREVSTGQAILELPIVSNIVGRWLKITDYGEFEKLRRAAEPVEQEEARRRLDLASAVNAAVVGLKGADDQTVKDRAAQIASDIYGDAIDNERWSHVEKKLKSGILRGQVDPIADAVLSVESIPQKVAILREAKKSMSAEAYGAWLRSAAQSGIVSEDMIIELLKDKAKQGGNENP